MKIQNIILTAFVLTLTACFNVGKTKNPNIELIQNMQQSPAVKAQGYDPSQKDQRAAMYPPDNTVMIGHPPYKYHNQPDLAGQNLKNPIADNAENLKKGEWVFQTYCLVCHGPQGHGDGPVAAKLALTKPPSLVSDKVKGWSDGRIFHVVTDGQGMMGSYSSQIIESDRWKLIHYIRKLQKDNK